MASRTDQRTEPRYVCGAPAKGKGPRGVVRGTCENISLGGMFVACAALPVGANLEWTVDLPAPIGPVQVVGEVRFVRAASGVGVRFTRLTPNDITKLRTFIAGAVLSPI